MIFIKACAEKERVVTLIQNFNCESHHLKHSIVSILMQSFLAYYLYFMLLEIFEKVNSTFELDILSFLSRLV